MENKWFSFLPTAADCKIKNYIPKIERSREKLMPDSVYYPYQQEILDLIIKNLIPINEEKHSRWQKEDYLVFRASFCNLSDREIPIVINSVLKSFDVSDLTILEELKELARHVEWYPEVERIKNEKTGGYDIRSKQVKTSDCYPTIAMIYKQMLRHIYRTAKNILMSYSDLECNFEMLKEISSEPETRDKCLSKFDDAFGYLKNLTLYQDVYDKIRGQYFSILLNCLGAANNSRINTKLGDRARAYNMLRKEV